MACIIKYIIHLCIFHPRDGDGGEGLMICIVWAVLIAGLTFLYLTCVILIFCVFAVVFFIRSQLIVEHNTILTTFNLHAVDVL